MFYTIVTVTYNAATFIEKTILSVTSQTCRDYEYIIIDGGSKDGSVEIIKKYADRLKWFSEPDKGIYDGMNKAISLASGDYILFLNADDIFSSSSVLREIRRAIINAPADIYYGSWKAITEHGEYHQEPGNLSDLVYKWVICHQATLVRTELLKEKPFDLKYRFCADFESLSSFYISGKTFQQLPIEIACVPIDCGASFENFAKSKREHYQIVRERIEAGQISRKDCPCSRFKTEQMIFRIGCVHVLKTILPDSLSHRFFAFLAKHYKVM